jgi:hypothetical protein
MQVAGAAILSACGGPGTNARVHRPPPHRLRLSGRGCALGTPRRLGFRLLGVLRERRRKAECPGDEQRNAYEQQFLHWLSPVWWCARPARSRAILVLFWICGQVTARAARHGQGPIVGTVARGTDAQEAAWDGTGIRKFPPAHGRQFVCRRPDTSGRGAAPPARPPPQPEGPQSKSKSSAVSTALLLNVASSTGTKPASEPSLSQ